MLAALMAGAMATTMPASAAETAWRACVDRTTTNTDWGLCGQRYIAAADAALNVEWRRLMTVVSGRTKTDLVAEERAWIAYRERACRFHANGDWGREGQVLSYPACVAGVIERRTVDLAGYRSALQPDGRGR